MTSAPSTLTSLLQAMETRPRPLLRRNSIGKLAAIAIVVFASLLAAKMLHIKYVIATGLKGEFGPATAQWQAEVTQQARRAQQLQGSAVFLGDSLTVGLAISNITARAENFGIDGDSIDWLLLRLPHYRLTGASVIVVEIGINDWLQRGDAGFSGVTGKYHRLLALLPAQIPLVMIGILPVNSRVKDLPDRIHANAAIQDANRHMASACGQFRNCHYIDFSKALADKSGNLEAQFDAGDGVHLSTAGYAAWVAELAPFLAQVTVFPHEKLPG